MKRRWRSALSATLLLLSLVQVAVPRAGAAAAEARTGSVPQVPVVLVPGVAGGPDMWEAGKDGGLWQDLVKAGYRPGRTLFRLDDSDKPDADVADVAARLGETIAAALRASGARRVDVIAHSSGALAARFYSDFLAPPGRVRTLVMIAPPIRGSFAADALRVAAFARALAADVGEGLTSALSRAVLQQQPDLDRARGALADESRALDEFSIQRRLVRDLWLPLMAWFVVQQRLLPERERPLSDDTFTVWLAREHPNFWAEVFPADTPDERADPAPAAERIRDLASRPPVSALTPAYERLLAFEIGNQAAALAQGMADARPPLPDLALTGGAAAGGLARGGWVSALWHAVLAWLGQWADRAVRALGKPALETGGRLAGAWLSRQWLGLDAASPILGRLVTESVDLPATGGDRSAGRAGEVPANDLLRAWNRWSEDRAPTRPTRYVVISGQTLNVWRWLSIQAGANDGAVEVAASLPPPGPLDVWQVVSGGYGATHFALPSLPAVRRAVIASLDPFAAAVSAKDGRTVRADVSDAKPAVFRVTGGAGRLEVRAPRGSRLVAAWLAPDGGRVEPLRVVDGAWQGDLPDGYVAVRLAPAQSGQPASGLSGTASILWRTSSGHPEPAPSPASERTVPVPPGSPGGTAGSLPAGAPGAPDAPDAPSDAGGPRPGEAAGSGSGDVPLIRVVLHSRLTTDRQPKLVEHGRWLWTFGDGERAEDTDPSHVVTDVSHVFARPGSYDVAAASYTSDGRLIRRLHWRVTVSAPGESHDFHAESIRAPDVHLDLEGPEAWVIGRPATFRATASVVPSPFVSAWDATLYPGPEFQVLWSRPGDDFVVRAAATLKVRYTFPDGGTFLAYDTYVTERTVDVYATSVVR